MPQSGEAPMIELQGECEICEHWKRIYDGICADCWYESVQPGSGIHDDLPVTLVAEGEDGACMDMTIGEFIAANPDELDRDDVMALLRLSEGESLVRGGGAAPMFWLSRRSA